MNLVPLAERGDRTVLADRIAAHDGRVAMFTRVSKRILSSGVITDIHEFHRLRDHRVACDLLILDDGVRILQLVRKHLLRARTFDVYGKELGEVDQHILLLLAPAAVRLLLEADAGKGFVIVDDHILEQRGVAVQSADLLRHHDAQLCRVERQEQPVVGKPRADGIVILPNNPVELRVVRILLRLPVIAHLRELLADIVLDRIDAAVLVVLTDLLEDLHDFLCSGAAAGQHIKCLVDDVFFDRAVLRALLSCDDLLCLRLLRLRRSLPLRLVLLVKAQRLLVHRAHIGRILLRLFKSDHRLAVKARVIPSVQRED